MRDLPEPQRDRDLVEPPWGSAPDGSSSVTIAVLISGGHRTADRNGLRVAGLRG